MLLKISPDNPAVIFVGGVELFKSTDFGVNFSQIGSSMHHDFHFMDINPWNTDEIVVVNDGGIYLSPNAGSSWNDISENLPLMNTYRIFTSGSQTFAGIQDNGFAKRSSATSWSIIYPFGDGTSILVSKFNANNLIGITGNDGYFKLSTDGGDNIFGRFPPSGKWDGGNDWTGAICEHPEDAGHFYTARRSDPFSTIDIWQSTNYGDSWEGPDPFGTVNGLKAPQNIVFSTKDPDIAYMSSSGYSPLPEPFIFGRGFFKSINGGEDWDILIAEDDTETIPFHYITRVITATADNPSNPDEVYITLSGFYQGTNEGHVFKSTNEGSNWININGNLPNTPVNDIIVWYPSSCGSSQKNISVATDVGIFNSTNGGNSWTELAQGLPHAPVMDIEYVPFYNKIRAATFGVGVWELNIGTMYITGLAEPQENNIIVHEDIIVCSGGKLKLKDNQFIEIASGKKIIIEDGGEIELSSGSVTFAGAGGIEINEDGVWDVNSCAFIDIETPITIQGSSEVIYSTIEIKNITFHGSGPILINNRSKVIISNCVFNYNCPALGVPDVCGIVSNGADKIEIKENIIIGQAPLFIDPCVINSTGIVINYGSNISIEDNDITNVNIGISVSNSSPFIKNNVITSTDNLETEIGISMDYSYSSVLKENEIYNSWTGLYLMESSPVMLSNIIETDVDASYGIYAESNSLPRLAPVFSIEEVVWDAGLNTTRSSTNTAMYLYEGSLPFVTGGCNIFYGSNYYINAVDNAPVEDPPYVYDIKYNTWEETFNINKFGFDSDYEYLPTGCEGDRPGGGSDIINEDTYLETPEPPQLMIIDYGNGTFDTVNVSLHDKELTADRVLFFQGMKQELLDNFNNAFIIYKQVISDYQDSISAINALSRLLRCKDRLSSGTTEYGELRTYYQGIATNNPTDTAFTNIASEFAAKCLVRMGNFAEAITEYENVITYSEDSLRILGAELNIIETYMIMQSNNRLSSFTGNYSSLKPKSITGGYKLLREKLNRKRRNRAHETIPSAYKLSQNYPNPFNPVTKISYDLPVNATINLTIYDVLGREVKRLVNNELKSAGSYIAEFNAQNYASGVYFYRIEATDLSGKKFVASKKMVLVK